MPGEIPIETCPSCGVERDGARHLDRCYSQFESLLLRTFPNLMEVITIEGAEEIMRIFHVWTERIQKEMAPNRITVFIAQRAEKVGRCIQARYGLTPRRLPVHRPPSAPTLPMGVPREAHL